MAGDTLLEPIVSDGERFIEALGREDVPVYAAVWVFDTDSERWELNIVSDWGKGKLTHPFEVLTRIYFAEQDAASFPLLDLQDVTPIRHDSEMGRALVTMSGFGRYLPRRLSHQMVEGIYIPNAAVYKIAA